MAWSYRKRVTIAPGIRLNFSKKGISTTIGGRGASINIGKNGTYLNRSIPGTGLYKRTKMSNSGGSTEALAHLLIYLSIPAIVLLFFMDITIGLIGLGVLIVITALSAASSTKKTSITPRNDSQNTNPSLNKKNVVANIGSAMTTSDMNAKANDFGTPFKEHKNNIPLTVKTDEDREVALTYPLQPYDPKADLPRYQYPTADLLNEYSNHEKIPKIPIQTIIKSAEFNDSRLDLPITLGKTNTNKAFVIDLAQMPHLLIASTSEQDIRVGLNVMLTSLLYKMHPSQLKLVLIDTKHVELLSFSKIDKHFLAKLPDSDEAIITDNQKAIYTLNSLCIEMDCRYNLLKDATVRNIKEYNQKFIEHRLNPEKGHHYLPYIVLVIDEFANLMMSTRHEVETPIIRLAQLARCVGIHLVLTTQHTTPDIITRSIRVNVPARIAFRVASAADSRLVLNQSGAQQLADNGDMLVSTGGNLMRVQCAFVDTPEVERVVEFIGNQQGYFTAFPLPEYVLEFDRYSELESVDLSRRDSMFEQAARLIVETQQGSTSLIQRKFNLGYNRSGRIMDQLEAAGIVGPPEGINPRQVRTPNTMALELLLNPSKSFQDTQVNQTMERVIADYKKYTEVHRMGRVGAIKKLVSIYGKTYEVRKIAEDNGVDFDNLESILPKKKKSQELQEIKETIQIMPKNNSHQKLHELIGLNSVKSEVETLTNFIKIQLEREKKGLKSSQPSYHCVFTGNPGTGKTTVARIIADIYKELGILKSGHLVEADRSGLIAEYLGQTAVKTNKIIDSALDGVLFIDEAYSLIDGNNDSASVYGKEAIATLLKRMEDNRDRLVVVLAGYTNEMEKFIDSNPGLQSRFNRYIEFPDYSAEELYQIFESNLKKYNYHLSGNVDTILKDYFKALVEKKDRNFGNARSVRNFFEKTLERQANRLAKEQNLTTEKLSEICAEDICILE